MCPNAKYIMFRYLFFAILLLNVSTQNTNQTGYTKDDEIPKIATQITDLAKESDGRLLLFSTLAGSLVAIEQFSGKIRWTIKDKSIITVPKDSPDALIPAFLPDPRDGSLYVVTPGKERLKKLSFTIPELVSSSPCRSSDGILYTGKKKDAWFSVNLKTGYREQVLGWDVLSGTTCPLQSEDIIFIGRTEYSIKMVDIKQPKRRWNVTFNEYSATRSTKEMLSDYELVHFTSSCSGNLLTLDRIQGNILWKINLGSPIVGAYILDPDGLISIPFTSLSNQTLNSFINKLILLEENDMKLYPTLYVGEHSDGLYALPSFVDQNRVTISNDNGLPLLLEGPDRNGLPQLFIEYPLPGQEYPLPHESVMDLTFQSLPSFKWTVIHLGHYGLPDYSNTKFLSGSNIATKLITDESFRSGHSSGVIIGSSTDENQENGFRTIFKVSLTVFLITPAILLGYLKSRKQIKPKPIETVDGCIKIGKITFNKREVLGKGCDGTFVYRGEFEGRRVAVKRMIPECFEFATREVEMLRESDAHPNVVRYFCMEEDEQFHYIALELCQATLADYIQDLGKPEWVQIDKLNILMQATKGLNHLHTLKIIHRDIKPQNVLLSAPGPNGQVKAMISDFGLSKKLAVNKTSMSMRSGYAGTEGWIAPEMLVANESITRAVDLFSLGCVYYYVLSNGAHPFGETFIRQANIKNGKCNLEGLVDNAELFKPLLKNLLSQDPRERPDCATVLAHPIFWTDSAVLSFLQDVSDRVEKSDSTDVAFRALETNAEYVVRGDWRVHIDHELSNDLRKYRSYRGNSLRDLLRALRNKKHHYHELTIESQQCLGEIPNEFIRYWTSRFPLLLIHTWLLMQVLREEVNFKQYYLTNHRFSTNLIDYNMFANDAVQYRVDMDELNPIWAKSPPKSKTQKSEGLYRNLRHPNAMPPMSDKKDSTSSRPKFFKYNRHGKYKLNSKQAADVPLTWVLPKLPPSQSEATTK